MKLIIAGSRSIENKETVKTAIKDSPFDETEISTLIQGGAEGVDSIAKNIFENKDDSNVKTISYKGFLDEAPNPKVAPLLRNTEMAKRGDALIAIWDGKSTGTEDMISKAEKYGLQIYIHRTDTKSLSDFQP